MYAYGLNNPITNVDPNGDFALSLSFGVAAITSIAPFVLPALAVVATVALVAYVVVNYDEIEAGFKNKVGVYNDSNLKENREIPDVKYPGDDPTKSPGEDWKWKGKSKEPGSKDGSWNNPKTGESLHPDLDHPEPIGPHWDYSKRGNKGKWRVYPDGRVEEGWHKFEYDFFQ